MAASRIREGQLSVENTGSFGQCRISGSGAKLATGCRFERPLYAVWSFSAARALCSKPCGELGAGEGGREWSDRE
jgi:hypothetical protein